MDRKAFPTRCSGQKYLCAVSARARALAAAVEQLEPRRLLSNAANLLVNGDIESPQGTTWSWDNTKTYAEDPWTTDELNNWYYNVQYPNRFIGRAQHEWVQDTNRAFAGTGSLYLMSEAPANDTTGRLHGAIGVNGAWISAEMDVTAGKYYVADAWMKFSRLIDYSEWRGPLDIKFYDQSGTELAAGNSVRPAISNQVPLNAWAYVATMPYKAPANAVHMKLRFGQEFNADKVYGGGDGTMYADNLAVWQLDDNARIPDKSEVSQNLPNYVHWFREATQSVQPPSRSGPNATSTYIGAWATVENATTGNLYYDKSGSATLDIEVTNLLSTSHNLSLQVTRTDWLGAAGSPANIPSQTVSAYATSTFNAQLPPTNSYGSYILDVQVKDGSSSIASTTGRYAVLPPLTRQDTVKNIWGVGALGTYSKPTTVLSDVFTGATGAGQDVRTLSGNAGTIDTDTFTPTGGSIAYTAQHQGSVAYNLSLKAMQSAVGGQAGLRLTNNGAQDANASGSFYTSVNVATALNWTAGSITTEQVKTLVLSLDYLSSGFANLSAGLYVENGGQVVDGVTEFFASATLAATANSTHKAVFLNDLSTANLQVIRDFLNANGGMLRLRLTYSGSMSAGASLSVADLLVTSTSLKNLELGKMIQTAGFGLAYVRLYDIIDDFAKASAISDARAQVEWYRNLGVRSVLQLYGSTPYTRDIDLPETQAAIYAEAQTVAAQFKDIVVAFGNWGIEQSNNRTEADPVYRPFRNGVMLSDAQYDTIAINLYNGLKSVAPNLPVLIGNIATASNDAYKAEAVLRMYGGSVNGNFDGAILNVYYNEFGMPNVTLEAFDRYGDTNKHIWIEENANPDFSTPAETPEDDGTRNLVKMRTTQAAKFNGRIESVSQWEFASESPHANRDMVTQALQPKAQYVAQAVMTDALSDATFVADHSTYNATPSYGGTGWDYPVVGMFEWQRSDGPMWVAYKYWRGSTAQQTFNVTAGSLTVMDIMGNRTVIPAVNGQVTLTLTDSPVYLFDGGIISTATTVVPTQLFADGNAAPDQIALTWTGAAGATYKIYRGLCWSGKDGSDAGSQNPQYPVTYALIASGVAGTSFIDTDVVAGTIYYYRVAAVKNGVESGKSNEASTATSTGGNLYMTVSDALGSSSFSNWSGTGSAPSAGHSYYNQDAAGASFFSIRTPASGATATFWGDVLHLNGYAAGGSLHLKGPDGQILTINNLYIENGATINSDYSANNYTIRGNLFINPGAAPIIASAGTGKTLTIDSAIRGAGPLTLSGNNSGAIAIGSTNNSLVGLVRLTNVPVTVAGDLSLGVGNIQLDTSARLTLSGGATNNYIADTANLSATTSCSVNLNFTGTDYVASVTLDGVTYTSGTFGAIGSGATHTSAIFTGTGLLAVNAAPTVATAASASPAQVNGPTTSLSALGADDRGEAALIYTWSAMGNPAGAVRFSANGTNAAKNTIATFTKPGTYTLQATITDSAGLSASTSVNVTVTVPSIYMSASDPLGTTSFTSGGQWSDALVPHAVGDYYNQPSSGSSTYYSIRTPDTGASAVFAGDSLHLMGSSGGGSLHLKGPDGQVITINNLYLENGATINADVSSNSYTLDGSLIINNGAAPIINSVATGHTLTIHSTIAGTGPLTIAGTSNSQLTVISRTNNTLSGDVRLTAVGVQVGGDLSLGTGDISMDSAAKLTLAGGLTDDYIDDDANLSLTGNCTINLNFSGTDYVHSVTIDGVTYTSGTVGPIGSGATHTDNSFTGTGTLTILNTAPTIATPAAANPGTVTGATTALSALGADDHAESYLTYTWATTGTPPAAVSFSANGTNAAKNTIATFTKAGTYNFRVTITDAGGLTTTSNVSANVTQTLSTITLTPGSATVISGQTQQFTATGKDQFGTNLTNQPTFTWSIASGVGSMNGSVYTASYAAGSATVMATSGSISGTAAVTVTNAAPTIATAPAASAIAYSASTLSVLGADDAGEANLTYTWSVIAKPTAAPNPTFSVNGDNAAKSTTATFGMAGTYSLRVTITDAGGMATTSNLIVTVNQGPYSGAPISLPGTVTLAYFDTGGEGIAYHDGSAENYGGVYRVLEGVDIKNVTSDAGYGDPYTIGWVSAGDWTKYTVNVPSTGIYTVTFRVSSTTAGGSFHLQNAAGTNLTGTLSVPVTGSFDTWTSVVANVPLVAGTQMLTFQIDSANGNYHSMIFANTSDVHMTATDAMGTTSFTSGANWSDGQAPQSGKDYFNDSSVGGTFYSIRTPSTGSTAIFNGEALHLSGGGSLIFKGPDAQAVTVNRLYLDNGGITTYLAGFNYSLNGNIIVTGSTASTIGSVAAGKTFTVNSAISGTGPLTFAGSSNTQTTLLTSTNNALTGAVTITNLSLSVGGALSLGLGNIALTTAGKLTLSGAADNNYIADSANLNLAAGTTLNLNFTGTDYVGSVTIAGTTYTSGTVGAIGSGATYTSSYITGAGLLAINAAPTLATAAAAAPATVTGTSTNLSVLGADDQGESGLTYTWATTGTPPAPVTFSANATNAARNTTATFAKAGTYALQVTITDSGGRTATSSVNVTVNQTLGSILVIPSGQNLAKNTTQRFFATAFDQFGFLMSTQPTITWSATGGTIASNGLLTTGNTAGTYTVTASSGGILGSVDYTILA